MSDQSVCTRCGYAGSPEAHYCARCGRALLPPRVRLTTGVGRWFSSLPPHYLGLIGLIASIPVGALVNHLLLRIGLHFSLSYLSLILIVGAGSTYLGWQWHRLPSNRSRLTRVLLVFASVSLLLVTVGIADKAVVSLLVAQGQRIVFDIPGVHLEASGSAGGMYVHTGMYVTNPPPYWLLTIAYAMLVGVASNLIRRLYTTLTTREREVRDLRENLLARVQDTAAQQERNRLARELHDSIKQQIFSIGMSAAAAEARWESDPQGAQAALGDLRGVAHEAMVEMNALLQQLSPAPLEKVGLVQALRDQCEALGYRTAAEVTVELGRLPADDAWPLGAQESLFRIAQEALSNVARHARARHVRLCLEQRESDGSLALEIADDGLGFDPDARAGGMGLDNIRQRVAALNGELAVVSTPGQGTTIRVSIPLTALAGGLEEAGGRQTHTINKAVLVGLAGGLALIAALFYPLYVLLPGGYVAGWPNGSQLVGLALEIVAAPLTVATGLLAAYWAGAGSRQHGALFGALAGSVAGVALYLGLGGAAAGVVGQGALLRHGLLPAAGDADLARLASEAMIGTLRWSHAAFWALLFSGAGLGAVGGLLAPVAARSATPNLRTTLRIMLAPAIWIGTPNLVLSVAIFAALEGAIRHTIATYAVVLESLPSLQSAALWPIGSAAVFYLVPLAALYFLSRGETGARDAVRLDAAQSTAIVLGLLSFGVASYLLIASPALGIALSSTLGAVIVVTAAASLVLGGGYLVAFVQARRQRLALGLVGRPHTVQIVTAVCVLWSVGMIIWGLSLPLAWGALVGLVVVVVDAVLFAILRRQPRQPASESITLIGLQVTLSQMLGAGLGAALAAVAPLAANVSSGASILALTIRSMNVLAGYNPANQPYALDFTLAELVRAAYLVQGRVALALLVGGVALVGLLMLAISGIMTVANRRPAQDTGQRETMTDG